MKITKGQLRRIIKEEKARLMEYGGRPYDPTVPGDYERYRDNPTGDEHPGSAFDVKLEKMADEIGDRAAGGYEPSIDGSPEAYADMILDVYLDDPPPPLDQMEDLEYVLTKPMYREQIKNAVLEYIGMMTEGRTLREQYHSMSPAGKSLSRSIKGKFMRMYPDAKVGIDGRGGFITVNGVKAIDMSQATGRGMSDEEMIDKMHAAYAQTQVDPDISTADMRMDTFREGKKMRITKQQLRRIIREEKARILKEQLPDPRGAQSSQGTGWDNFSDESEAEDEMHLAEEDLPELLKAIDRNQKQAASVMEPEQIEMYEDDASQLQTIYDMSEKAFDAMQTTPPEQLSNYISRLDTMVREQIPLNLYNWIVGQR